MTKINALLQWFMAERFYSIVRVPSLTVLAYSIRIAMMMIFGMCCVPIVD